MVEVMSKGAEGDIALPLSLKGIGENTLHMDSQFASQKDQGIMAISEVVMRENNPERRLPSLHQAIPEYHTRLPRDRERGHAEKLSSSPLGPLHMSPPTSLVPSPTPKKRRFSPSSGPIPIPTPDSVGSPTTLEVSLDAQNATSSHSFSRCESSLSERSPISDRRRSGVSTSSSLSLVLSSHESPPLPSLSSMTPEETSPLDTEMPDRPNLPSVFGHGRKSSFHSPFDPKRPVLSSPYDISARQNLSRYPHTHRDHRILSSGSLPIYPPYPPRHPLSSDRLGFTADRSPFSSSGHHSDLDLGMDYYEHSRGTKRRRGNLPKPVTDILRAWLHDHISHPYPTEEEKQALMIQTGLSISQISNWFINARRRRVPVIAKSAREDSDLNMTHQVLQRT